jgi:large subunit ribosomal protein L29
MKAADIRELTTEEITKKLRETRDELAGLRVRKPTGQLENTSELRKLRRDIARFQTLLLEKQRAEAAA